MCFLRGDLGGMYSVPPTHYHKDNLRHLPRFPGFFVTFRILIVVLQGLLRPRLLPKVYILIFHYLDSLLYALRNPLIIQFIYVFCDFL